VFIAFFQLSRQKPLKQRRIDVVTTLKRRFYLLLAVGLGDYRLKNETFL